MLTYTKALSTGQQGSVIHPGPDRTRHLFMDPDPARKTIKKFRDWAVTLKLHFWLFRRAKSKLITMFSCLLKKIIKNCGFLVILYQFAKHPQNLLHSISPIDCTKKLILGFFSQIMDLVPDPTQSWCSTCGPRPDPTGKLFYWITDP